MPLAGLAIYLMFVSRPNCLYLPSNNIAKSQSCLRQFGLLRHRLWLWFPQLPLAHDKQVALHFGTLVVTTSVLCLGKNGGKIKIMAS